MATAILFSNWKIKRWREQINILFHGKSRFEKTKKFQKFPPPYLRIVKDDTKEKKENKKWWGIKRRNSPRGYTPFLTCVAGWHTARATLVKRPGVLAAGCWLLLLLEEYIKNEKREMKEEEKTTNHHLNRFFYLLFFLLLSFDKDGRGGFVFSQWRSQLSNSHKLHTVFSYILSTTGLFSNLVSEKARQKQEHKQPSWLRQRGWFYSSSQLFSVCTFPPTKCQVRVAFNSFRSF